MVRKIKRLFKNFGHTVFSTYVCLKYPFLYQRNRFTGLHYNDWKIIENLKRLYSEAFQIGTVEEHFKPILVNKNKARQYKFLKWYHDKFLQAIHWIPNGNELDALKHEAPGWYKAFGWQICREIKKALLEDGGRRALKDYRITQIKEKWGELCWYTNWETKETGRIVAKYEYISRHTCIECGRSATCMTTGYVLPYCDKCYTGEDKTMYYTEELPFYGHYRFNNNKDKNIENE